MLHAVYFSINGTRPFSWKTQEQPIFPELCKDPQELVFMSAIVNQPISASGFVVRNSLIGMPPSPTRNGFASSRVFMKRPIPEGVSLRGVWKQECFRLNSSAAVTEEQYDTGNCADMKKQLIPS